MGPYWGLYSVAQKLLGTDPQRPRWWPRPCRSGYAAPHMSHAKLTANPEMSSMMLKMIAVRFQAQDT